MSATKTRIVIPKYEDEIDAALSDPMLQVEFDLLVERLRNGWTKSDEENQVWMRHQEPSYLVHLMLWKPVYRYTKYLSLYVSHLAGRLYRGFGWISFKRYRILMAVVAKLVAEECEFVSKFSTTG